jgi:hypothetical protein
MPVELVSIPLNSGVRQDMDEKLHPDGLFESLTNARLRKTGSLGVRLGYTALGTAAFGGGTLRAFDVVSHDDTLLPSRRATRRRRHVRRRGRAAGSGA